MQLTQDGTLYEFSFAEGDAVSKIVLLLLNNMSLVTDVIRKKAHVHQD